MRLAAIFLFSFSFAQNGIITSAHDGDTFRVLLNGRKDSVRLKNIDAPEIGQPFGIASRDFARRYVGDSVSIVGKARDKYHRLLATIYKRKMSLNKKFVRLGYAWAYRKYLDDVTYVVLEKSARKKRLGLWIDLNPVPPWEWRKAH